MKKIKTITIILTTTVLLFILFEGLCSTVLVTRDIFSYLSPLPESPYTKYDKLLGWISIPNVEIKNFYSPSANLKINSQSFRSNQDFSIKTPKNKTRILCCGDSFTFGQGVDNKNTWCEKLASVDERLETINMGQIGYGIDQAYLWYMRDGKKFEHNVQIFAFISDDFNRMKYDRRPNKRPFYGKPVLKLASGILEVKNVPVPYHPLFF